MERSESTLELMGHIVAGFPSFQQSLDAAVGICLGGARYLEIQFPFSDPNADGIAIANACEVSLKNGFNTDLGFEFIAKLQQRLKERACKTQLLIMTYGNILFSYGVERFLQKAKENAVYGLIVPDLSLQNDEKLFKKSKKIGLENIALIAPLTSPKRIGQLTKKSGKFVYVVARNGITGDTTEVNQALQDYIRRVQKFCKKPIALGFGIQSREQIETLGKIVPIVVVGSAFVREIDALCQKSSKPSLEQKLCDFTQKLLGISTPKQESKSTNKRTSQKTTQKRTTKSQTAKNEAQTGQTKKVANTTKSTTTRKSTGTRKRQNPA